MSARPPLSAWLMLAALAVIWGAAFMATSVATAGFGPFTLAAGRLILGALTLVLYLLLRGEGLPGLARREDLRFWGFAFAVAFLSNAMPFVSLSWAQRHVDSSLAGVFMATVPLFVLPLGHFFVAGESMTRRKIAGFVIGFAGMMVLLGPSLTAMGGGGIALLAQGACLLAAFGYASGGITSKLAPQRGLIRFAAATLMLSAFQVVPLALIFEEPFATLPPVDSALALLYLALLPTALAQVLLLAVIDRAGPGFLSLVNYQVPVWAVIFGWAFLGEAIPGRLWIALALILAGLAISQNLLALRRGAHARG